MSNSQLNKLKSRVKNGAEITLKLSSNIVGASNDANNFYINCYWLIHRFQGFVK